MQLLKNQLYHIYNRGNNKQRIFFSPANYKYFLKKVKKHIVPYCDILAWCLMPNHFHFMIHTNDLSMQLKRVGGAKRNVLSEGFRFLLSHYALGINRQNGWCGSLFQQNTKSKYVSKEDLLHARTCFHYIHQNPFRSGMINNLEDWKYSSFHDYCDEKKETFVNRKLAVQLLDLNLSNFYEDSYRMLHEYAVQKIF